MNASIEPAISQPTRFIRVGEVIQRTSLARQTLYDHIGQGRFPAPVKLGRLSVWLEHEVQQWIEDRVEESRAA